MNKVLAFILTFFFISGTFTVFNHVSASVLVEDSWNTKTPMTQARAGLGVVAVEEKIYAIGGVIHKVPSSVNVHISMDFVSTNECYDPKTNRWTTLAPMPTPRANFAIVAYDGKIYCIGGEVSQYIVEYGENITVECSIMEVYDTVTNRWSTSVSNPSYPESFVYKAFQQAYVMDDKIFVRSSHVLYMYDPSTDTWTQKNSIAKSTTLYSVSTAVDDKIIVCAEFIEAPLIETRVLIYEPKTDVWHDGTWPTFGVGLTAAVATSDVYAPKNVYFMGRMSRSALGEDVLANITVYDPLKNTWTTSKAIPTSRTDFGVAVVDDLLYVIGGWGDDEPSSLNEQYVPLGYDPLGYKPPPATTATSASFLTGFVVVVTATVLATCGVIITLFFYLGRKRTKGNIEYE